MPPVRASELELSKAPSAAEDLGSESAFDEVWSRAAEARSWASAAPDAEEFLRSLDLHSGLGRHFGGGVSPDVYELVTQMRLIACQSGAVPRVRAFCAGCDAAGTVAAVNHYVRSMCPGRASSG